MVNTQVHLQLENLISLGAHLGHKKKYYNTTMSTNLVGYRGDVDIINLEKTLISLRQIYKILYQMSLKNNSFLMINTTSVLDNLIDACSTISRQKGLNGPWVPGTLTNFVVSKQFLKAKKLALIEKLPDLVLVLNAKQNEHILKELFSVGIPTMCFADSDINISKVTYPIPSNDDSYSLLYFYLMYFSLCLRKFSRTYEIDPTKTLLKKVRVSKKRYFKNRK